MSQKTSNDRHIGFEERSEPKGERTYDHEEHGTRFPLLPTIPVKPSNELVQTGTQAIVFLDDAISYGTPSNSPYRVVHEGYIPKEYLESCDASTRHFGCLEVEEYGLGFGQETIPWDENDVPFDFTLGTINKEEVSEGVCDRPQEILLAASGSCEDQEQENPWVSQIQSAGKLPETSRYNPASETPKALAPSPSLPMISDSKTAPHINPEHLRSFAVECL
ncbi:uncharacterized protein L199_003626 [Kwoniella botswanensis]|uniref:uncharacterized protein n=1 Tax=Kwoniella botswanensis TaxID=1268659 RepID=UPI00315D4267